MYIFPSPISHEWNNRSGSIKETRVLACYGREKISNNRAIFVHFLYYFPTVFIDNFLEQYSSRALSKRDILRKLVKEREELYFTSVQPQFLAQLISLSVEKKSVFVNLL